MLHAYQVYSTTCSEKKLKDICNLKNSYISREKHLLSKNEVMSRGTRERYQNRHHCSSELYEAWKQKVSLKENVLFYIILALVSN